MSITVLYLPKTFLPPQNEFLAMHLIITFRILLDIIPPCLPWTFPAYHFHSMFKQIDWIYSDCNINVGKTEPKIIKHVYV